MKIIFLDIDGVMNSSFSKVSDLHESLAFDDSAVRHLKEIINEGVTGFLVSPHNSDELADRVITAITGGLIKKFRQNIAKNKDQFSWEGLVDKIETKINL